MMETTAAQGPPNPKGRGSEMKKIILAAAMLAVMIAAAGCSPGNSSLRTDSVKQKGKPPSEPAYSFVVISDTHVTGGTCAGPVMSALPGQILSLDPDFVIVAGDLVDWGRDPSEYETFKTCMSAVTAALPVFPGIGNHDTDYNLGGGNFLNYMNWQLFEKNPATFGSQYMSEFSPVVPTATEVAADLPTVPSGFSFGAYYTFKYKNARFLMFEQGAQNEVNTPTAWAERELDAARESGEFLFVVLHHPMYSAWKQDWYYLAPVREPYYQKMKDDQVLAVFSGHTHINERYFALYNGAPSRGYYSNNRFDYGTGMHHVTNGTSGDAWYPPDYCTPSEPPQIETDPSWWLYQNHTCGHTLLQVEVGSRSITIKTYGIEGGLSLRETVTIKNLP
jgi:hypothetical protein